MTVIRAAHPQGPDRSDGLPGQSAERISLKKARAFQELYTRSEAVPATPIEVIFPPC